METPFPAPDHEELAMQLHIEHVMLMHIKEALQIALDWETATTGNVRKLSTMRFVAQSFHRHLARLRALAEYGGYLSVVSEAKPNLAGTIKELQRQRDRLQAVLEGLMSRLEDLPSENPRALEELCGEFGQLLKELEEHDRKEIRLYQEAILQEEGGMG